MPRRTQTEPVTNDSESFGSTSSSSLETSDAPLPTPTTLLSDIVRTRSRRSASHPSRSNSASAVTSRNSSRTRRARVDDVSEPAAGGAQVEASEIANGGEAATRPTRGRRRAYSIRDELDAQQDDIIFASPSSPGDNLSPPPTPRLLPVPDRPAFFYRPPAYKRRKLNNSRAGRVAARSRAGPSTVVAAAASSGPDVEVIRLPGEPVVKAEDTVYDIESSPSHGPAPAAKSTAPPTNSSEPLAEYTCPICFSSPRNATLTPCGHVCCGECLFTAVRSTLQRAAPMPLREPIVARCPVCRAAINGWDGRGGGVIGLKPRSVISL